MRSIVTIDDSNSIRQSLGAFLVRLKLTNILQSVGGALAAVSSLSPIVFFLISFFVGIGSGSSVLIGPAKGAGDLRRTGVISGVLARPAWLQRIWYASPIAFVCSLAGNLAYFKFFWLPNKLSAV